MNAPMIKVTYEHWKTGELLEIIGTMPTQYNNSSSDRILVETPDGHFEDIIKKTIKKVEPWNEN